MPTPKDIATTCVAQLKAAKAKAIADGKTVPWPEVAKIIEQVIAKGAIKPAVRLAMVEAIYAAYPRKVGREAALRAIARAAERVTGTDGVDDPFAHLLAKAGQYATAVGLWPEAERQYVPHPSTWFNQGRYSDDPATWVRGDAGNGVKLVVKDYSKL